MTDIDNLKLSGLTIDDFLKELENNSGDCLEGIEIDINLRKNRNFLKSIFPEYQIKIIDKNLETIYDVKIDISNILLSDKSRGTIFRFLHKDYFQHIADTIRKNRPVAGRYLYKIQELTYNEAKAILSRNTSARINFLKKI